MGKLTDRTIRTLQRFDPGGALIEPQNMYEAITFFELKRHGLIERITGGGIFNFHRITEAGRLALQQAEGGAQ